MGGMALGVERAGFHHQALIERNAACVETLRMNSWPKVKACDAKVYDYTKHLGVDLVCGGPPCQPFSLAGQKRGANDDRDGWPYAVRAVWQAEPRAFLFENVPGLLSLAESRPYFEMVKKMFTDLGYDVSVHQAVATDYGVPQKRHRVFLVGFRSELGVVFKPPAPVVSHAMTVREALAGLAGPHWCDGHYMAAERDPNKKRRCKQVCDTLDPPAHTILAGHWRGGPGGARYILREDDGRLRRYTSREVARLQGFGDDYQLQRYWMHAIYQLGNACPPPMAEAFAYAVRKTLEAVDKEAERQWELLA